MTVAATLFLLLIVASLVANRPEPGVSAGTGADAVDEAPSEKS